MKGKGKKLGKVQKKLVNYKTDSQTKVPLIAKLF
jgi:hypothetical protein